MATQPGHISPLARDLDLLELHALAPERYPFLLDSSGSVAGISNFDILFAFPGEALTLAPDWQLSGYGSPYDSQDFLSAFDRWWSVERRTAASQALPFNGGWFVFLAYELARQIEPGLELEPEQSLPIATAVRIPAAVIRDRQTRSVFLFAESGSAELLDRMHEDIARIPGADQQGARRQPDQEHSGRADEDNPRDFIASAQAAKTYIAQGDVYQANISRQWRGQLAANTHPWMVYDRLRRRNPAPFSGIAALGESTLVSSSPERLVAVRDGRVETRPIAGTRPRTAPDAVDDIPRSELVANPKERAEHIMLIDLERNDLGRICSAGSVRVDDFMTVESYAHVHHIVSNVSGVLRPGTTPGAVLRAMFPGGTITGCPKVRCMSIIHELEGKPRGAYTGSMGYINLDGSCDFNILIRTIAINGSNWQLSAGSGIVADSVPERELEETRAKAKGMLLALGCQA